MPSNRFRSFRVESCFRHFGSYHNSQGLGFGISQDGEDNEGEGDVVPAGVVAHPGHALRRHRRRRPRSLPQTGKIRENASQTKSESDCES